MPADHNASKFTEPTSIQDAEERINDLQERIRDITLQLSNKNRLDSNGNRLVGYEYHDWRRRALAAKNYCHTEVTFLKQWIKNQHRKMDELRAAEKFHFDPDSAVSLLAAMYKLVHDLSESNVQITREEWALVDVVRDHLKDRM